MSSSVYHIQCLKVRSIAAGRKFVRSPSLRLDTCCTPHVRCRLGARAFITSSVAQPTPARTAILRLRADNPYEWTGSSPPCDLPNWRGLHAAKDRIIFVPLVLYNSRGLVGLVPYKRCHRIIFRFLLALPFKQRMVLKAGDHPVEELLNIGYHVDEGLRLEYIGVLCEQLRRDNSLSVFLLFEVWVGVAEKHLLHRCLLKVVDKELHDVGSEKPDVVVGAGKLLAQLLGAFLTELLHAVANLQSDHELVGKLWAHVCQEASISAPDIDPVRGELRSVGLLWESGGPVHIRRPRRHVKIAIVQWVRVRPRAEVPIRQPEPYSLRQWMRLVRRCSHLLRLRHNPTKSTGRAALLRRTARNDAARRWDTSGSEVRHLCP
mmetsp:Transcript_1702/g.5134  ORF Transcript_1702/g.5134 Transcript_1702/m.5134 type:complete len:376 (+) Transcript_1702:2163-3290(+)